MVDTSEPPLVPHRACGDCNVCCVALTIDDPALQKPQGYRCRNTLPNKGCAIYETRPTTCSTFYCGWRTLKWIREPLRPDTSQVLVRMRYLVSAETGAAQGGVIFTFLSNAGLKAEGLAESVAAAVAADLPVWIHVPGPPGYTSSEARIDEVLRNAVITKDKKAVLDVLRRAHAQGRSGPRTPIVLKHAAGRDREGRDQGRRDQAGRDDAGHDHGERGAGDHTA